jgi:Domain of unknown function (DUF4276)
VKVSIYVEGGGDQQNTLTECRHGFAEFIRKMLPGKAKPRVIPCGGRTAAYKDFCTAVSQLKKGEKALLLVDSEEPVSSNHQPWKHLNNRKGDGWVKPDHADEEDVCMMVQCMESWFLADPENIATFYRKDFKKTKLPKLGKGGVESISKQKVEQALKSATSQTAKGTYHKTRHGFALLAIIEPDRVIAASEHASNFRDILDKWLDER